jgi:hypothetical protein
MNKWGNVAKLIVFISIVITGCVEPYSPPVINENISLVVVDGFINGTDSSARSGLRRQSP